MTDLLIIVPSRGRPQSVPRLINAWTATAAWDHAALVIAIDADDPHISAYRRIADQHRGSGHPWWLRESPKWQPMVHKLNQTAQAEAGDYFAAGFAGDDHLPRTTGWAKRYLDELHNLGTGIVYGDDLLQHEAIPTQWAMTSNIVQALGRMVPAPVAHLNCDSAIYDLGHAAGCIRYLPDVIVEHMHPAIGKAPEDPTYALGNSQQRVDVDGAAYRHWRAIQLAHDAATVLALRHEQN